MTTPAKQFARELAEMARRLRAVERGSQMSRRSIEGGGVKVYDADGVYRGTVGIQDDGRTALTTTNDPLPPTPSTPILTPVPGGLEAEWDGTFADGSARPSDLRQLAVHAAVGVYTPSDLTRRAVLPIDGSRVFIALPEGDPYTVVFIAETTGGSVSSPSGVAVETPAPITASEVRAYQTGPDGDLQQTVGLGTGADVVVLTDPITGRTTTALTGDGSASFQSISVAGTDADGDGVSESGFSVYGRDLTDWLEDRASGTVASAFYGSAANGIFATGITTRFGLGETSFVQQPGRQYMVVFSAMHAASTVAGDKALFSVRFTQDGSTPTISNGAVIGSSIVHFATANQAHTAAPIIGMGSFPEGATVRLLVTVERLSGTGTIGVYTYTTGDAFASPFRFFATDLGRDIPDTYIANDGGGVRAGGNPSATGKQTYTSTWGSTFVGAYFGSGSRRTDTTDLMEGYTSYYPAAGTEKSIAGFMGGATYGEVGKTVAAALAGASISKVEIFLHCNHSNAYAGGTSRIGYHGNTTLPATAPNATYEALGNAFFKRGESRWITLPSSTYASWLNGTYRGVTVGPGGDYMRFDGAGSARPALRITYTR